LFQIRNPAQEPESTIDKAAIESCPLWKARKYRNNEEIATVPDAPPSTLSKKLIEFVMPTIQKTVIRISRSVLPLGDPSVFDETRTKAIPKPTVFCATNLGHGEILLMSSINPIIPIRIAGIRTVLAVLIN